MKLCLISYSVHCILSYFYYFHLTKLEIFIASFLYKSKTILLQCSQSAGVSCMFGSFQQKLDWTINFDRYIEHIESF